jgi:hypothetical protein
MVRRSFVSTTASHPLELTSEMIAKLRSAPASSRLAEDEWRQETSLHTAPRPCHLDAPYALCRRAFLHFARRFLGGRRAGSERFGAREGMTISETHAQGQKLSARKRAPHRHHPRQHFRIIRQRPPGRFEGRVDFGDPERGVGNFLLISGALNRVSARRRLAKFGDGLLALVALFD